MQGHAKVIGKFWNLLSQSEKELKWKHSHWSSCSLVFSHTRKEQKLKRFSGGIPEDLPAHSDISNQWPDLSRPHLCVADPNLFPCPQLCFCCNALLLSRAMSSRLAAVGLAATPYSWLWWVWVWAESHCAVVCSVNARMTTDYLLYSQTHLTWSFTGQQTAKVLKWRAVCARVSAVADVRCQTVCISWLLWFSPKKVPFNSCQVLIPHSGLCIMWFDI